jgi:hypothetical protein
VLVEAIRSSLIDTITINVKHFPKLQLSAFDIEAWHPDLFIIYLTNLNPEIVLEAFKRQVVRLKNPIQTEQQVLQTLKKLGLPKATSKIGSFFKTR